MLRRIGLVVMVGAAIGLWACTCPPPGDEIFLLRMPDSATQMLIDRCLQPGLQDCLPLCEKVSGVSAGQILHCEIHQQPGPFIQVHIGVQSSCPGGL
jgi:hypothetical protein